MKPRDELMQYAQELGYEMQRETKHSTRMKHPITGVIVGISHTPGDNRGHLNCKKDLERGAVTQGKGLEWQRLEQSITNLENAAEATIQVLKTSGVPMKTAEISEIVLRKFKVTPSAISVALQYREKRGAEPILKLERGWHVYDQELFEIPAQERRTAIDAIVKAGPRRAYREPGIRSAALAKARKLLEPAKPVEPKTEPKTTDKPREDQRLFELLARDPERGVAFLRDEEGLLWIARRAE